MPNPGTPTVTPAATPTVPEPNAPVTPNAPGQTGSWEADLASFATSEPATAPAPATNAPEEPAAVPAATPPKPTVELAKPAAASKPAEPAGVPGTPKPTGRKAKLDPDELLSVDGLENVELPASTVEALKTLDARDLRLQSAKLAHRLREVAVEMKRRDGELESLKTREDPEKTALLAQQQEWQKRYEGAQKELSHANYLKSDHYVDNFQKPFERTLAEAYDLVKEFQVIDSVDELGNATTHPGSARDFDELINAPRGTVATIAKKKFGDGAEDILHYARKLFDLRKEASRAVEDHRKSGEDIEKKRLAEQTETRALHNRIWNEANETVTKKYPEFFAKSDDDPDGNKLLESGYGEVDRINDQSLTTEQRIQLQVGIRHRAAAFTREVHRRRKAESRIAELEKIIEDYQGSEPTKGAQDGAPAPASTEPNDAYSELDKIAAGNR